MMFETSPWFDAERMERAEFVASGAELHVRFSDVCKAAERLAARGISLPPARRIEAWRGHAHVGTVLVLDAATCAMHLGRGLYITLDVQRDLNGERPPDGVRVTLTRSGTIRRPDSRGAYNFF